MALTGRTTAAPAAEIDHHVAALDGVRAVAILLVLAFHLNLAGVWIRKGGYLGVDVFFVLSGFLITSLLLRERHRTGRVSLGRFWHRRALRLVPVGLVLLLAAVVVFVTAPTSYDMRPQPVAFLAYVTAWMNWLQIWRPRAGGMLGHTWSLALETQFYVVWPPVVIALLARSARLRWVGLVAGVGIVVAVVVRIALWHSAPPMPPQGVAPVYRYVAGIQRSDAWLRWYFGSFSRMDGMLVGALAAVVLTGRSVREFAARRPGAVKVAAGLGLLVVGLVVFGAAHDGVGGFVPDVGLLALELGVAVLVVALVTVPRGPVAGLLGLAPLVWIGRRSYAMYMLHIPIWMAVTELGLGHRLFPMAASVARGWLSVLLTFGVAALSYRFVERPALARR